LNFTKDIWYGGMLLLVMLAVKIGIVPDMAYGE
jgi:hypothetical protein